MDFVIHNECGHPTAEEFLGGFLGPVFQSLAAHLGRVPAAPVHVVLSDRASHERRFPPKSEEVLELEDLSEIPEDEREQVAQRFPWTSYAHGVTTRAAASQSPPAEVTVGDLCVYLDVESIESISEELEVLFEGMLGRVAAHELSHAIRGHATDDGRATHGWYREGDAQRAAWHVLTELMGDPNLSTIARWGRAAQVRLADRQPAAYRYFGCDWSEQSHLRSTAPLDPPTAWIVRPPRDVFVLANEGVIEVPISIVLLSTHKGAPRTGDLIYLGDSDLVAGPWVVVRMRTGSRLDHPKDRRAVEHESEQSRAGRPKMGWFQLRPFGSLAAGADVEVRPTSASMLARELEGRERSLLAAQLTSPARELAQLIAEQNAADLRRSTEQLADMGSDVARRFLERDTNPFDAWH